MKQCPPCKGLIPKHYRKRKEELFLDPNAWLPCNNVTVQLVHYLSSHIKSAKLGQNIHHFYTFPCFICHYNIHIYIFLSVCNAGLQQPLTWVISSVLNQLVTQPIVGSDPSYCHAKLGAPVKNNGMLHSIYHLPYQTLVSFNTFQKMAGKVL